MVCLRIITTCLLTTYGLPRIIRKDWSKSILDFLTDRELYSFLIEHELKVHTILFSVKARVQVERIQPGGAVAE